MGEKRSMTSYHLFFVGQGRWVGSLQARVARINTGQYILVNPQVVKYKYKDSISISQVLKWT